MIQTAMPGVDLWRISPEVKAKYDEQFFQLKPINGYVTGDQAKNLFLQSGLPPQILAQIWALADRNADGKMDSFEFAIAMHLIQMKLKGAELPKILPSSMQVTPPQSVAIAPGFRPPVPVAVGPSVPAVPTSTMAPLTAGFIRPASPVDAKLQRSGSVSSQDSPTGVPPPLIEWAVPQQSKLKYTQLFNSYDRTRTGFLTGAQARNILVQTGLSHVVLAQIWSLADIDADGRLSCEEFVLAMHLTDCVKAGDTLPPALPPDLIPPSHRRKRSTSIQSNVSVSSHSNISDMLLLGDLKEDDKLKGLPATFEDKRRENFEKGQAELERRRLALLESQRKEQEERERKEREEQERRERIRQEQERRRQLELEKQLAKQRELEQEKEEQRRKALEQREAARREMERQRQLEWEKQRQQELLSQRQKEQEAVCHLKNVNKNLTFELEELAGKIKDLNEKISETRKGVTAMKSSIDDMRNERDTKLKEIADVKLKIKEFNDRLLVISQEKLNLKKQLKEVASNPTSDAYNTVMHSFNNKEITLHQLRNSLSNIEKETAQKQVDIESANVHLKDLKDKLNEVTQNHKKLYKEYEERKNKVLAMKNNGINGVKIEKIEVTEDDLWGQKNAVSINDSWNAFDVPTTVSTENAFINNTTVSPKETNNILKYRALYAFEARNPDELSIMPGDIIQVADSQSSEPGWLGGELHGKRGWFPEAYAERIDSPQESKIVDGGIDGFTSSAAALGSQTETIQIVGTEMKRTLEGISEAPENGTEIIDTDTAVRDVLQPSENSSFTQLAKTAPVVSTADAASPVPGQGQTMPDGLQAQALFPWKAKKENHLSFNKGDVINVKEQQDMWWYGEIQGKLGWFPKSYVKLISGPMKVNDSSVAEIELENDVGEPPEVNSTPPNGTPEYYTATYAYQSQEPGDLCFQLGDTIKVIKKEGEWWTGIIDNRTGIFPSNYVRKLEPNELQYDSVPVVEPEMITDVPVTDSTPVVSEYDSVPVVEPEMITDVPVADSSPVVSEYDSVPVVEPEMITDVPVTDSAPVVSESAPVVVREPEVKPTIAPFISSTPVISEATKTLKKSEIVTVIAAYQATGPEQLSLERGQLVQVRKKSPSGWWEGEIQVKGKKRQIGWFPASYVKPLSGSGASSNRSTPEPIQQKLVENTSDSPLTVSKSSPEQVVALYNFVGQHDDELTFQKGETIIVLSKDDPSWWKGEVNGAVGLFPSNYVEAISKSTASVQNQCFGDGLVFMNLSLDERKRQQHIYELISTEESYVADMSIVLDTFQKPLRESMVLTKEELLSIFVNWKELIVCNTKLLRAMRVRKRMSPSGVIQMIGDLLCENLPHFTPYIRFCSCQLNAAALIQQKSENSPKFNEVAKKCCTDPRTKGMPLSSFLLKPMQRITKYPLLIRKILQHTSKSHPDYQHLEEALSRAEQLCNQVNEGVRENENSDRLEWIQNHVSCDGLPEQITFNSLTNSVGPRKLLHAGIMYKVKSNKELMAFLFNDFLLLTQPMKELGRITNVFTSEKAMTTQYKMYKKPVFLHEISIKSTEAESSHEDTTFIIANSDWTYHLKSISQAERQHWMKKIEQASIYCIEVEKKNRQSSLRMQGVQGVGRLLVVVVEGNNLKECSNGRSDPYCKVSMGFQEHKTKVVPNTLNPRWNASMQFLVRDLQQDVLCISVFHRDVFSPNDFLGRTEIRVSDIFKETSCSHEPIIKNLVLYEVDSGQVVIKLDLQLFRND